MRHKSKDKKIMRSRIPRVGKRGDSSVELQISRIHEESHLSDDQDCNVEDDDEEYIPAQHKEE